MGICARSPKRFYKIREMFAHKEDFLFLCISSSWKYDLDPINFTNSLFSSFKRKCLAIISPAVLNQICLKLGETNCTGLNSLCMRILCGIVSNNLLPIPESLLMVIVEFILRAETSWDLNFSICFTVLYSKQLLDSVGSRWLTSVVNHLLNGNSDFPLTIGFFTYGNQPQKVIGQLTKTLGFQANLTSESFRAIRSIFMAVLTNKTFANCGMKLLENADYFDESSSDLPVSLIIHLIKSDMIHEINFDLQSAMVQLFKKIKCDQALLPELIGMCCQNTLLPKISVETLTAKLQSATVNYEYVLTAFYAFIYQDKCSVGSENLCGDSLESIPVNKVLQFTMKNMNQYLHPKILSLVATRFTSYFEPSVQIMQRLSSSVAKSTECIDFSVAQTHQNISRILRSLSRRSVNDNTIDSLKIISILSYLITDNDIELVEIYQDVWMRIFSQQPKSVCLYTISVLRNLKSTDIKSHGDSSDFLWNFHLLFMLCEPLHSNSVLFEIFLKV